MIELIRVGFFREMYLGTSDDESFEEARGSSHEQERILAYLEAGHLYRPGASVRSGAGAADVDVTVPIEQPDYRTDGRFVWSSELPHYVRTYQVSLPDEFIEHMAAFSYRVPDHIALDRLAMPAAEPTFAEFVKELREVWPEFVREVDVPAIKQRFTELGQSVSDFVESLFTPTPARTAKGESGAREGQQDGPHKAPPSAIEVISAALHALGDWLQEQATEADTAVSEERIEAATEAAKERSHLVLVTDAPASEAESSAE